MWTHCVVFVACLLALSVVPSEAVCGETLVWRNNNLTCPDRAVCADVFETTRDWYNGTRCEDKRILHNCLCAGRSDVVCPYNNPENMLYASANHRLYTCEPTCNSLPWCNEVMGRHRLNAGPAIALTAEQNAAEFGHRTYYKLDCRCPRHHTPYTQGRGVQRAVKAYSHRYNYQRHRYSTLYVCNNYGYYGAVDPCESN